MPGPHATPPESVDARDDLRRGIVYALIAIFSFSLLNVVVKWQSATYPIIELVFFRSAFALIPCAFIAWRQGGWWVLATPVPGQHVCRALIWFASVCCTFASYYFLPLADAVAIGFSAPLFLTALSGPVLGETVGRHRWAAVIAGFIGVLVMVRPGAGVMQWGAVFALGNAFFFAIGSLTIRRMSRTERSIAIVFYTMLVAAVLSGLALPFVWVTPSLPDFGVLVLIGASGGLFQLSMVQAYRYAPVSAVAPFNYTSMVWALLFGYLFWGDLPDGYVLAGAAIVMGSGLYILHRETRRSPAPAKPRLAGGD